MTAFRHPNAPHDASRPIWRRPGGWVAAGLCAVIAGLVAVPACVQAPTQDTDRAEKLEENFRRRRLPRHRVSPPIPAEASDLDGAPLTAASTEGPSPERFWVDDMVAGDPLTALTRQSDLYDIGPRGFRACVAWVRRQSEARVKMVGVDATHVLTCLDRMLDEPARFAITPAQTAELAGDLAPFLSAERLPGVRHMAFRVLGRVFTKSEAALLARGIAESDAGVRSSVADALTTFSASLAGLEQVELVRLQNLATTAEVSRLHRMMFAPPADFDRQPAAWNPRQSDAPLQARFAVSSHPPRLRVIGPVDAATEGILRNQSPSDVWQQAVRDTARTSRAAFFAVPVVWELLDHPTIEVRAQAAHCLRQLTGDFAPYRAGDARVARVAASNRWATEILMAGRPPEASADQ